jgi:exodeoxyribonuclease VII large subunit
MPEIHIFSVGELNRTAKRLLEDGLGSIWVRGEISNLSIASSGHAYFTLVGEGSEIAAVRFRSRLPLPEAQLRDGIEVLAFGRLTIYGPRGRYQLVVTTLQPAGLGAQQAAFERLKAKLLEEGLFSPERKKPLPAVPRVVGVITSATGAALRDIASVLRRRWPLVEVLLVPTAVQGATAADEIARALRAAGAFREDSRPLDALIVGRGGGSAEDLAPFNDERVARAIHACPVPVISAVGHEIDFTIADFVADRRAPTPSAAAEMLVPNKEEVLAYVISAAQSASRHVRSAWIAAAQTLDRHGQSYVLRIPWRRLEAESQRLDQGLLSIRHALADRWKRIAAALATHGVTVGLSDPHRPLKRGYSLTFVSGTRTPLVDSGAVTRGSRIETQLWRGRLVSEIKEVEDADAD